MRSKACVSSFVTAMLIASQASAQEWSTEEHAIFWGGLGVGAVSSGVGVGFLVAAGHKGNEASAQSLDATGAVFLGAGIATAQGVSLRMLMVELTSQPPKTTIAAVPLQSGGFVSVLRAF